MEGNKCHASLPLRLPPAPECGNPFLRITLLVSGTVRSPLTCIFLCQLQMINWFPCKQLGLIFSTKTTVTCGCCLLLVGALIDFINVFAMYGKCFRLEITSTIKTIIFIHSFAKSLNGKDTPSVHNLNFQTKALEKHHPPKSRSSLYCRYAHRSSHHECPSSKIQSTAPFNDFFFSRISL